MVGRRGSRLSEYFKSRKANVLPSAESTVNCTQVTVFDANDVGAGSPFGGSAPTGSVLPSLKLSVPERTFVRQVWPVIENYLRNRHGDSGHVSLIQSASEFALQQLHSASVTYGERVSANSLVHRAEFPVVRCLHSRDAKRKLWRAAPGSWGSSESRRIRPCSRTKRSSSWDLPPP